MSPPQDEKLSAIPRNVKANILRKWKRGKQILSARKENKWNFVKDNSTIRFWWLNEGMTTCSLCHYCLKYKSILLPSISSQEKSFQEEIPYVCEICPLHSSKNSCHPAWNSLNRIFAEAVSKGKTVDLKQIASLLNEMWTAIQAIPTFGKNRYKPNEEIQIPPWKLLGFQ